MLEIHQLDIPDSSTNEGFFSKRQIVLSATGTLQSAVDWAHSPRQPFSLPAFVVDRDGTIYNFFNFDRWSRYLNVGAHDPLIVNVALANCGPLRRHTDGLFYPIRLDDRSMPLPDTSQPPVRLFYEFCTRQPHRSFTHFELIYPAQLRALQDLLPHLLALHRINYRYNPLTGTCHPDFVDGRPGIYLACDCVKSRADLHPQPELIRLLKTLSD